MTVLKKGMYVRCPVDGEDAVNPRMFAIGQIVSINQDKISVVFYDLGRSKCYFENIPSGRVYQFGEVERCNILPDTNVIILNDGELGKVLYAFNDNDIDSDDYYKYFIQVVFNGESRIKVLYENEIKVQFNRSDFSPLKQMLNYEFQNPVWYHYRNIVSSALHILKNATHGFSSLIGSRVFLFPHQVDTIIRAVCSTPCRFILADEVGLGKTIETCVIMKGLKERLGKVKTLIIAPDSLVYQWKNELSLKFWMDIPVNGEEGIKDSIDLIFPLEKLTSPEGKMLIEKDWDLCIVDETHRLMGMQREYEVILELSKKIRNVLLLSATPIQQRKEEYLKLLMLLENKRYANMSIDAFSELLEKQQFLKSKVYPMVRDIPDYHKEELFDDYYYDLKQIADKLNDKTFRKLVDNISCDSNDSGLSDVKLALAYIGEHYQIERRIIRHRRLEIRDRTAERRLNAINYELVGSDRNFYEADTYDELMNYLQNILEFNENETLRGEFV